MSNLVVVVFDDETSAFEMRTALMKMERQYLIELEDSVVVTRNSKGKIKLDQVMSLTTAGAIGGGFWGMLVGLFFLNPLLGAAVGATAGAVSGRFKDLGIDDKMMRDVAAQFKPGSSAVFFLARRVATDKVLAGLAPFAGKGKLFQTSLDKDDEEKLRDVLEQAA
jgi:uncharacterized membrane protein